MSYRLADEGVLARKLAPLYHPTGLFFLTMLFWPLAMPFWFLNWRRLRKNALAWLVVALAVFGVALPIFLAMFREPLGFSSETGKTITRGFRVLLALGLQVAQNGDYAKALENGHPKAPAWHLWTAAGLAVLISLAALSLDK